MLCRGQRPYSSVVWDTLMVWDPLMGGGGGGGVGVVTDFWAREKWKQEYGCAKPLCWPVLISIFDLPKSIESLGHKTARFVVGMCANMINNCISQSHRSMLHKKKHLWKAKSRAWIELN